MYYLGLTCGLSIEVVRIYTNRFSFASLRMNISDALFLPMGSGVFFGGGVGVGGIHRGTQSVLGSVLRTCTWHCSGDYAYV